MTTGDAGKEEEVRMRLILGVHSSSNLGAARCNPSAKARPQAYTGTAMVKPIHDMSSWGAALHPQRIQEEEAEKARQTEWEATRQVNSTNQWANSTSQNAPVRQVGKQIAGSLWELFVVFDPVDALQQQFEAVRPEYLAMHDIGTNSSRRMLQGLAAATGTPVHQLHIRRQGHGVPMARLEFVELPVGEGQAPVRLYTTQIDADSVHRHRLALLLLAYSRLGAVMVGDLAPHALASALEPLKQTIKDGPWLNRRLLTLPLSKSATVAAQMQQVVGSSHIKHSVTPQVTRPAEAWNYLRRTWNGVREELAQDGVMVPEVFDAPTPSSLHTPTATAGTPATAAAAPAAPQPTTAGPATAAAGAAPGAVGQDAHNGGDTALQTYLQRCAELKGLLCCTIFDLATRRPLAEVHTAAGHAVDSARLALQGARLLSAIEDSARQLQIGPGAIDACITVSGQHLVVKSFSHAPALALHALFDRSTNLTLARLQLQRLDMALEEGSLAR
jgi:hypothetical protein